VLLIISSIPNYNSRVLERREEEDGKDIGREGNTIVVVLLVPR